MDKYDAATRSRVMRQVKSKDTSPEMKVRRLLYRAGYRYRLHASDLPGKPDVVFRSRRKAIFVHGCYWHQHPGCPAAARPASNRDYWDKKLDGNVVRDSTNLARLDYLGWQHMIVWECELSDPQSLLGRLEAFLAPPRST